MSAWRRNCATHEPPPPKPCCFRCWAPFRISPLRARWQTTCRSSPYVATLHKAMCKRKDAHRRAERLAQFPTASAAANLGSGVDLE